MTKATSRWTAPLLLPHVGARHGGAWHGGAWHGGAWHGGACWRLAGFAGLVAAMAATSGPASGGSRGAEAAVPTARGSADASPGQSAVDPAVTAAMAQADAMAARAAAYLRSAQAADGSWSVVEGQPIFPGIAGLVLTGLIGHAEASPQGADEGREAISRGVAWMLSKQRPDGGIYDAMLPSYNTAIAVAMLARVDSPQAQEAMLRGRDFLLTLQYGAGARPAEGTPDAPESVDPSHPYYGGVGYGRHGRPDLSNTQWFIEALDASGLPKDDPAYERALVFLRRTQMLQSTPDGRPINEMPYAQGSTQGGFAYATSVNRDRVGEGQSFAGEVLESLSGPAGARVVLTLASGKTLLRADVEARVRAALEAVRGDGAAASGLMEPTLSVALGPTADGRSSGRFEILVAAEPERARAMIEAAFAAEVSGEGGSVSASASEHTVGVARLRAYGSMTYAGYKSLIFAGLSPEDPRVVAARAWLEANATFEENPGLGTDGLYYYFAVSSRALGVGRIASLPLGPAREPTPWGVAMVERLARLQEGDGSFRPVDDRWMESNPVLITAYSLMALNEARAALRREIDAAGTPR